MTPKGELAPTDRKFCPKCEQTKVAEAFYRCCARGDGRYYICRQCCRDYPAMRAARKRYKLARRVCPVRSLFARLSQPLPEAPVVT